MQQIYVEDAIQDHPRVQRILDRFSSKNVIVCNHYGEIFNRKNQSFRQQKQSPALILANKTGKKVLPTPPGFGIGGNHNYYFSHLLNCPFDCRYCFLQGMYPSAHYVLFVNYEDFMDEILQFSSGNPSPSYFFSGYDADSLAYEPISEFLDNFIPFFNNNPQAILELRSKSTNIRPLLQHQATPNIICAFSLTPDVISKKVEYKVPPLARRLVAMQTLADRGYRIGLRFDPLIYADNFIGLYEELIKNIQQHVPTECLHSISIGTLRFPEKMFQKIYKQYPKETILNQAFEKNHQQVGYSKAIHNQLIDTVSQQLQTAFTGIPVFNCQANI